MRPILLYFVKYPEPGRVKTRLAKTMGTERAAKIYRELAEANLKIISSLSPQPFSIVITFAPPEAQKKIKTWLSGPYDYWPQTGNHLGERLQNAFESAFLRGAQKVVALGSDTLDLEAAHLLEAYEQLESCDVVLGPAEDGGYYLIGSSRFLPDLYVDIPWSTSAVLDSTLKWIKKQKLTHFLLKPLNDLDDMTSLEKRRTLDETFQFKE